jgi:hypothetical protein
MGRNVAVVAVVSMMLGAGCLPSASRMRQVQDVRESGVPLPGTCRDASAPRPDDPMERWLVTQHDVRVGGCARRSF